MDLVVTQTGFRNEDQIEDMIDFVAKGGIFDHISLELHSLGKDLRPINIVKFEDGRMFIHDGHHRIASIYLGGRKHIFNEEYKITNWKYSDYLDINFKVGWVTPFDPRTHVRIPNYFLFKKDVYLQLSISEKNAEKFIIDAWENQVYVKTRTVLTIQDLLRFI